MRILIANNTLDILAGSETWCLTMAKELKSMGHEVMAYSDKLGFMATRIEEAGIHCVKQFSNETSVKPYSIVLEEQDDHEFDLIICNHHHISGYLKQVFPNTPMIVTIHGILHKDQNTGQIFPEHPNLDVGVDAFVAVSEEVQKLLKDSYDIDAHLVRNPIDLELFAYNSKAINKKEIKTIFFNSNYQGKDDKVTNIIRDVAEHFNADIRAVGANFQPAYDVQDIIKDSDVVVGMGRSVIEGIAMGKIGLVHGRWGTGGVITPETVEKLSWFNFSGRNSAGELKSAEEVIKLIEQANTKENADAMYEYMTQNHDVRVVAKKYLDIADDIIQPKNAF